MPIDYSLGKIYKIIGGGKIYVGSTCERLLCQRLAGHYGDYRRWVSGKRNYVSSFECLNDGDAYIELLELCPCSCRDELRKCEGKWIKELDCVNKRMPGAKMTKKEYYHENKEVLSVKAKEYYQKKKAEKLIPDLEKTVDFLSLEDI